MSNFTQNNTFTNVHAAAAGRDGVTATAYVTIGTDALGELRSLIGKVEDGDERDEVETIVGDIELATKSGDDSLMKRRLQQLGRFAGSLTNTALRTGLETWIKLQISGLG